MGCHNTCRYCIPNAVIAIFGIILGIINAVVWYFGYIQYVRPMIPFALGLSVLILITISVLKVLFETEEHFAGEAHDGNCIYLSLRKYSPAIIISTTIFIIFSIVVLATYLPDIVRFILAFIGSISFWIMIFSFSVMLLCMLSKRIHH